MTRSVGYDLHQVYPATKPSCLVVFLLPSHQILTQGEANVLKGISQRLLVMYQSPKTVKKKLIKKDCV